MNADVCKSDLTDDDRRFIACTRHVISAFGKTIRDARPGLSEEFGLHPKLVDYVVLLAFIVSSGFTARLISGESLDDVAKAARAMQAKGLDPRTFDEVAASIAGIEDPTARAQKAFEMWGKTSGATLLPMLENLQDLRKQARDAGLVMSTQTAKDAARLGDAMNLLRLQGVAVAQAIGGAVAPSVTRLAETLSAALPVVIDFIHAHSTLVTVAASVGFALTSLGSVIAGVGLAARAAAQGLVVLRASLTALSRHPYLIAITGAATALALLAEKFLFAGERAGEHAGQLDRVTTATQAATAATHELAEAQEKSVFAQALARIESEKNVDAVQEEVDRIKKLNDELRVRYKLQRERGVPLGVNPQDARFDPNRDNPFNDLPLQDFGRQLGEGLRDLLGRLGAKPLSRVDEAALKNARELRDTIVDQLAVASRDFRGGVGGRFAGQIAGVTAAEAREARALRLEEKQVALLQKLDDKMRQLLGQRGVLVVGNE